MNRVLLVLCLVLSATCLAQTITQAEYFIGTDPGEGMGTAISVTAADDSVALAWQISTAGLAPNLYRMMLRVRTDGGVWSRPSAQFLIVAPIAHSPLLVTQFEWSVDGGEFTAIDIDDAEIVSLEQLLSTVSLAPGVLHKVNIRVSDNTGRVGLAHCGFLAVAPPNEQARLVTQFEYAIDNGEPIAVDLVDGASVPLSQMIATDGLSPGTLHRIKFRVTDDLGRVGAFTSTLLPVNSVAELTRNIVSYEYWVDANSPMLMDCPDAPFVNISELIATNSLYIGLHQMNIRAADDLGRTGPAHRVPFIVTSPWAESEARTIAAAEMFVNSDPGIGNGIAIPLPEDGEWNESEEPIVHLFTGFNVGYYRVGIRVQDNLGRWSAAEYDSLLVGPLLSILPSGNSVILYWEFPENIDQYYIYRAAAAGPFTLIDSTSARTYTDPDIIPAQEKGFYHITFRDDSISLQRAQGTNLPK